MSSYHPFHDLTEQLGYVQCSFCATILLVSVPPSSLSKVVTVKCGHCTALLSVSLVKSSFVPLQLLASLGGDAPLAFSEENQLSSGDHLRPVPSDVDDIEEEETQDPPMTTIVNKPPEKRQRAPSAYNRFIKEEIQRIKATHPRITHKEAFSTAAKNWAHFPRIQHKRDGESCSLGVEYKATSVDFDDEVDGINELGYRDKKVMRQSLEAKTPFGR